MGSGVAAFELAGAHFVCLVLFFLCLRYAASPSPEDKRYRDSLSPPCATLVVDNVSPEVSAEDITAIFAKVCVEALVFVASPFVLASVVNRCKAARFAVF